MKGNVLSYGLTSKTMVTIKTNHHMYMRLSINLKMSSYIFICIKVFYNFDRYYTGSKNSLINNVKFFKPKPEHYLFIVVGDGACHKAQAGLRCSDLPSLPPSEEMKTWACTTPLAPPPHLKPYSTVSRLSEYTCFTLRVNFISEYCFWYYLK